MIGAIIGDVVGSVHEHGGTKSTDFPLLVPQSRFTDDTVMTIATAEALLSGEPYDRAYRRWGRRYPHAGYGGAFRRWLQTEDAHPYGSWGNGSAMRVRPVALACDSVERVLAEAERSAAVTHDHLEGIKGPRPRRWPCSWPGPEPARSRSGASWPSDSATTYPARSTRSAPRTGSMCGVRCRRPSGDASSGCQTGPVLSTNRLPTLLPRPAADVDPGLAAPSRRMAETS